MCHSIDTAACAELCKGWAEQSVEKPCIFSISEILFFAPSPPELYVLIIPATTGIVHPTTDSVPCTLLIANVVSFLLSADVCSQHRTVLSVPLKSRKRY